MADEKTILSNVRVLHRIDKTSNWNDIGATPLLPGEIGVTTNDQGKVTGMAIGYNIENGEELDKIISEGRGFYPGVGAGYTLPDATFNSKGGVKPSQDYYTDPDSLTIKGLTWLGANGFKNDVETLLEREIEAEYDSTEDFLRIKTTKPTNALVWGDLYARSITTTKINNQEETDQYITSRLMYLNSDGNYFPDVPGVGLIFMDAIDSDNDGHLDYDTLLVNNGKLTYNNVPFLMLSHTEAFENSRYFKFKTDGSYEPIDKIPLADIEEMSAFTITVNKDEQKVVYTPSTGGLIDLTIPRDHCNEMIINGVSYKPINNVITLEFPVFTEEMRTLIQSAVQTLTLNNTTYSGPTIRLNLESDETIDVNSIENGLKINLNSDLTNKIRSGVQSFTINGEKLTGNDLVYDIEGSNTITVESTGGKSSISLNSDYTNRIDSAIQTIEFNGETLSKENNKYSIEGSDSIDITSTAGKSVVTLNETLKNQIQSSAQSLTINGQEFLGPKFSLNIESGNSYNSEGQVSVANSVKLTQNNETITLAHYDINVQRSMAAETYHITDTNYIVPFTIGVSYDNLGHVFNNSVGQLNFKALLDRIATLEEKVKALENK